MRKTKRKRKANIRSEWGALKLQAPRRGLPRGLGGEMEREKRGEKAGETEDTNGKEETIEIPEKKVK